MKRSKTLYLVAIFVWLAAAGGCLPANAQSFAYVANGISNNVSAYKIDSTTGALTQLSTSPFAAGQAPVSVAIAVVDTTEPFVTFKPQAVIDLDENAFVSFVHAWYRKCRT